MYRRTVLCLLLLFTLAGCGAFPGAAACSGLAIGVLTGDEKNDPIAQEQRDGFELALQEINAAQGIGGCQLTLVNAQAPTTGDNANQTRQAVRSLIEDGRVIAILGGQSSAAMQAATLVNYFEVPLMIPSASGSHVLPDNNLWAFRLRASEESYAQAVAAMLKNQLTTNKSVVILFEDTTEGHDAAAAAVKAFEGQLLQVATYLTIPLEQGMDYNALAQQVNGTRPGAIYMIFNRPDQATRLFNALQNTAQPVPQPLYVAHAGGFASQSFLSTGAGNNNLLIATQWVTSQDTAEASRFNQSFAAYTLQKYGKESRPTLYHSEAYKSLMILAAATRNTLAAGKASPADIKKMRTQLREELFVYQEDAQPWSAINFSSGGQSVGVVYIVKISDQKAVIQYSLTDMR